MVYTIKSLLLRHGAPGQDLIDAILPVLVDRLSLKEGYEENKPIFECIKGLL